MDDILGFACLLEIDREDELEELAAFDYDEDWSGPLTQQRVAAEKRVQICKSRSSPRFIPRADIRRKRSDAHLSIVPHSHSPAFWLPRRASL